TTSSCGRKRLRRVRGSSQPTTRGRAPPGAPIVRESRLHRDKEASSTDRRRSKPGLIISAVGCRERRCLAGCSRELKHRVLILDGGVSMRYVYLPMRIGVAALLSVIGYLGVQRVDRETPGDVKAFARG